MNLDLSTILNGVAIAMIGFYWQDNSKKERKKEAELMTLGLLIQKINDKQQVHDSDIMVLKKELLELEKNARNERIVLHEKIINLEKEVIVLRKEA